MQTLACLEFIGKIPWWGFISMFAVVFLAIVFEDITYLLHKWKARWKARREAKKEYRRKQAEKKKGVKVDAPAHLIPADYRL